MRKILLFILLFLLATSLGFGQKQNDWTKLELKGRVKSLKTTATYRSEKEGMLTKWQSAQSTFILFDKNGYSLEKLDYKEDGSLFYKTVYTLNADSQLTQSLVTWPDGKPGGKTTFCYDNKGNMIEEINYKPDGSIANTSNYKYDANGNKTENSIKSNLENQGSGTSYYEYDNKGNLIKTSHPLRHGGTAWYYSIKKYNEKGKIIEEGGVFSDDGPSDMKTFWKYDDKGNVAEIIITGIPALEHHSFYIYEYDKQGNWIKKTSSLENMIPRTIEDRVIEYY